MLTQTCKPTHPWVGWVGELTPAAILVSCACTYPKKHLTEHDHRAKKPTCKSTPTSFRHKLSCFCHRAPCSQKPQKCKFYKLPIVYSSGSPANPRPRAPAANLCASAGSPCCCFPPRCPSVVQEWGRTWTPVL
jgi:hypothetical protein